MSEEEVVVAEQVVPSGEAGALTVRISQHRVEDFWRVEVSRGPDQTPGQRTATVAPGDSFMMNLIRGAVDGEDLAWRHLAQWGHEGLAALPYPAGRKRFA